MLLEFEDFAEEHSVKGSARRSEGGGASMGYRLFRRPQISCLCVIVFVCLGYEIIGFSDVSLWVCGLGLGGLVCVCVFACLCLFAACVFCVITCDCMFVF